MEGFPWFPLWAVDFMNSRNVRTMTPEQVGVYILLLCHEWNDGPLPDDPDQLSVLANNADTNTVRTVLERCFRSVDGTWVNDRLETVREEQQDKRLQKVRAGKASGKARRRKKMEQCSNGVRTQVERTLNESESESETEGRGTTTDVPSLREVTSGAGAPSDSDRRTA